MTLQLLNLSKSVSGREILKDINWEISQEDCFLLEGPAGSGKTLLIRLMLGLEKPDSGSVNLLGDYKYSSVNAGVVFQEDRLCEQFSAVENVAMVNKRLSERVAGDELLKFLPEERIWIPVSELSEVERRLVAIVRASIIPSDILLLDEPLRGMDSDLRKKAVDYIRDRAGHKGIVFAQRDDQGLESLRRFVIG
jgi:ABC-type multidrug transport system ATPase subunit